MLEDFEGKALKDSPSFLRADSKETGRGSDVPLKHHRRSCGATAKCVPLVLHCGLLHSITTSPADITNIFNVDDKTCFQPNK